MNINLPPTALKDYAAYLKNSPEAKADQASLHQRLQAYRQWSADRLRAATRDDLVALFSPLWSLAMCRRGPQQLSDLLSREDKVTGIIRLIGLYAHIPNG